MSVIRYSLENCIGCRLCMEICPMDVFRFNEEEKKSVIAFPENCQSCGQCFFFCPGKSLAIDNTAYGYNINSFRGIARDGMDRTILAPEGRQ
ncbi:MAG: 4Fe-4S dicluster domain-containing protein [Lachnospiraceae bacterium]|nr:4Fe-4S dicluster domain-containing protein [Lachnospiraceae bacterium]